ncbi:hypothetical protein dsx2_1161 [Desulfovibrio sp. X2]|uniref:PilZ domain-containing protein n=1 Tax=Desulfovibrio sp. X2 TaxID=941449 RepID=UPI000358E5C5|nr:PilZ domain-containing protein [Desulfovibrio sp. X2]EPR37218.1 hypothetical protein dsx2_1161 [Desulfovibrio sp. X2]
MENTTREKNVQQSLIDAKTFEYLDRIARQVAESPDAVMRKALALYAGELGLGGGRQKERRRHLRAKVSFPAVLRVYLPDTIPLFYKGRVDDCSLSGIRVRIDSGGDGIYDNLNLARQFEIAFADAAGKQMISVKCDTSRVEYLDSVYICGEFRSVTAGDIGALSQLLPRQKD